MPIRGSEHIEKDGGPAFPHAEFERCPRCGEEAIQTWPGLSKREEFAKVALQGIIMGTVLAVQLRLPEALAQAKTDEDRARIEKEAQISSRDIALEAVTLADAMLETLATA